MFDPRKGNNFIDANVLDRTGGPEDAAVDEILRLYMEGDEFTLLLPYSVKDEIAHPNTPAKVKERAALFVFSQPVSLIDKELALHERIRELIRGNAASGQHDKDAFHLVESHKYGARFFITNDKRLLKKSDEILEALTLKVVTPPKFLEAYRSALQWDKEHHR